MRRGLYISIILCSIFCTQPFAQIKPKKNLSKAQDSIALSADKQRRILGDSLQIGENRIRPDSLPNLISNRKKVAVSPDSIPSPITYGARDTMWFDKEKNEIHLYGQAFVKFEKYEIKAGYIIFDFENDVTYAEGRPDENGKTIEKPEFSDGTQLVNYNRLKYNFKTKKGLVYDAVTTEGELYVLGATTKFISAEGDSLLQDDHVYQRNALITSCNHEHPHYGIRCSRLKVVPGKIAVAGPSNLEIAGVKTPFVLPFGFFPINNQTASSGLIFPNDYQYSQSLGFGFREVGYYFPINDHIDLRVTGDIYTRGTYGIRVATNYKKRYAYNGNLRLGFSDNREENSETGGIDSRKAFSINLSHDQSPKAHPYRKLGGMINISTSDYRSDNFNDATSVLQNTYRSNFNYSHSMPNTPFSMRMGISHDQNTQTGIVNVTFPDVKFNMNTIYPFKKKNRGGNKESWYEKINVKYDGAAKAYVRTQDSLLFTEDVYDKIQTGISHKASTSASFRALKYFNVVPSVNYDEIWLFRTLEKVVDENRFSIDSSQIADITAQGDTIYARDTIFFAADQFNNGFDQYRSFNANISISTQLFSKDLSFEKGWLRGFRHVMKPTVSFGYNPSTRDQYEEVFFPNPVLEPEDSIRYNRFAGGAFNTPPLRDETMGLNYSIINILEGKFFSKKDSSIKKVKFFDNITVSGSYNFAADSIKWSPLRIRGNTKILKGLSNFQFSAGFDFYERDDKGQYINQTIWSQNKKPVAFNNFMGSFITRLKFSQIRDLFRGKEVDENDLFPKDQSSTQLGSRFDENPGATRFDPNFQEEQRSGFDDESLEDRAAQLENPRAKETEEKQLPHILDLLDNFSLNHTYNFMFRRELTGVDTFFVNNNSLAISGKFDLTDNWSINFDRISYDFKNRALVYPSLVLTRDLHCWSMNFRWAPERGVYSFFIGVKASTFDFMKYNYGQNRQDGRFR